MIFYYILNYMHFQQIFVKRKEFKPYYPPDKHREANKI